MSCGRAGSGTAVEETCRKLGILEPILYQWKKRYADIGVPKIRRLSSLRRECQAQEAGRRPDA